MALHRQEQHTILSREVEFSTKLFTGFKPMGGAISKCADGAKALVVQGVSSMKGEIKVLSNQLRHPLEAGRTNLFTSGSDGGHTTFGELLPSSEDLGPNVGSLGKGHPRDHDPIGSGVTSITTLSRVALSDVMA